MATLYRAENNVLKADGRVFGLLDVLTIKGYSNSFPFITYNVNNVNEGVYSWAFRFNKATSVSIDYGDGTIKTAAAIFTSGYWLFEIRANLFYPANPHEVYYYADGLSNVLRTVRITYDKSALILYTNGNTIALPQPLNFKFANHPGLGTFVSNPYITDIDFESITYNTNPALNTINLNFFHSSSAYYSQIPLAFLDMRISTLTYGNAGYVGKTFAETNEDKLYMLAATLSTLNISAVNKDRSLPDLSALVNLRILALNAQPNFLTAPSQINGVPWITSLTFIDVNTFTSFGDYSACTALNWISYNNCQSAGLDWILPSYYSTFTDLKTLIFQSSIIASDKMSNFINSLYNIVVANASMSTGNTKFRQMTVSVGRRTGDNISSVPIPTGVYQAPVGYVKGSNNGSPASDLERIYVMVDNYGHTWSWRTS